MFRAPWRCRCIVLLAAVVLLGGGFASPLAAAVAIQRVESPGGIVAWLVRDPTVPVISMSFAFDAGAVHDPAGKEGRAQMTAALLDEGAGDLDSQAFHRRLEDIAMSMQFSARRDSFRGSIRTLSANRDAAFRLLALALARPRFDPEAVERIRAQTLAALEAEEEDPQTVASHAWFAAVFPDHPYGRPVSGTSASVKALTAADFRAFMRDFLTRDRLRIAVVGDIAPDELARRLDEVFGELPATGSAAKIPEAKPAAAGRTIVIERNIPQSVVVFGQPGVGRRDPDWYAAYVMNRVLGGGGFSSRLTEVVREKRGLAYSVYSYLVPLRQAPLIMGGVATANARVAESLSLIRAEWRRMAEQGMQESELEAAKTYINGSFPLRFDSSRRIADILVSIQMDGLGIDYIDRRPALIDAVTLADVRRVARRLLRADALTVVIVGKPAGIASTAPDRKPL